MWSHCNNPPCVSALVLDSSPSPSPGSPRLGGPVVAAISDPGDQVMAAISGPGGPVIGRTSFGVTEPY